jgi:hypothetical protein
MNEHVGGRRRRSVWNREGLGPVATRRQASCYGAKIQANACRASGAGLLRRADFGATRSRAQCAA